MRRSEKFLEIQAAMLKARPAFEPLKKTKENKHFGSKYADLEGAIDASIKALTDNGLLLIQSPGMYDETNRSITLTSFLSHTSGEWFEDDFQMPVPKADPQGVGTAISYARRYAQLAMFNLAAEDDDGNHASGTAEKAEIRKPQALRPADTTIAPQKLPPPHDQDMPVSDPPRPRKEWVQIRGNITEKQAARIFGIGKSRKLSNQQILEHIASRGYENTNAIPMGPTYEKICSELEIA